MAVDKLLLAEIESVYGTDPNPDGVNVVETMDLEVQRYEGDTVTRNLDKNIIGGKESINTNPHSGLSFAVGAQASGTAGTAPAWGILMQACGFDETIVPATSVAYELPAGADDLKASDSITAWDYREGVGALQKINGIRGANSYEMGRGQLPKLIFANMLGSYATPIAGAPPAPDWSTWKEELPFTNINVPVLTLDSVSACTESFKIDFGQQVGRRNLPGCDQTIISDYNVTGEMTIVAPDIGTKNWFVKAESHDGIDKVPFAMTYGTTAGLILSLSASEVQIGKITEGESAEGDLTYSFALSFLDSPILTLT